jgi:hypothetical protein
MKWRLKMGLERISGTKSCFFEKISKINKPLPKTQINKIRDEKGIS